MDKIPSSIAERTLLCNKAIEQYILDTSAYPNEHEQLKELREATIEKYKQISIMNTMPDEAQFLSMLLKLINAKNTLEIGVFTGYSLLITALTLPKDGKVVGIDPFKEAYEVGLPFIKKAGVEHKVEFIQEKATLVLDDLINQGKEGAFDFAFVDADKGNYINYHEQLLKLVKVGGIIAYDNTLWLGSVAYADDDEIFEKDSVMKYLNQYGRTPLLKLNTFLASDPRIESTLLSVGDGLTLCRRKH